MDGDNVLTNSGMPSCFAAATLLDTLEAGTENNNNGGRSEECGYGGLGCSLVAHQAVQSLMCGPDPT